MRVDDLNYELPPDLIAQTPAERRDAARLMVVSRVGTRVEHRLVSDLPAILVAGDLLVLNDTRVIPARFYGRRADTGGAIEGLYLGSTDEQVWHIMLKAGGRLAVGQTLALDKDHHLVLIDKQADGSWLARRQGPLPTHELLDSIGVMPLPPYIHRNRADQPGYAVLDRQRYQTVYARRPELWPRRRPGSTSHLNCWRGLQPQAFRWRA
jgi:S-adenosylmethionine:tRNA ribosyltransferase-isomerase